MCAATVAFLTSCPLGIVFAQTWVIRTLTVIFISFSGNYCLLLNSTIHAHVIKCILQASTELHLVRLFAWLIAFPGESIDNLMAIFVKHVVSFQWHPFAVPKCCKNICFVVFVEQKLCKWWFAFAEVDLFKKQLWYVCATFRTSLSIMTKRRPFLKPKWNV